MTNSNNKILKCILKILVIDSLSFISLVITLSMFMHYFDNGYKDLDYAFLVFLFLSLSPLFFIEKINIYDFEKQNLIVASYIFIISFLTSCIIYNISYYGQEEYYKNISIYHVEIEKRIISKNYDDALNYISKFERFKDPAFIEYKKEIKILKEKDKIIY